MVSPTEKPKYLYKILSSRHWQASQNSKIITLSSDDDAFIHLATEEQLDKIIAKFWPDASQYVILKVATDQLVGDLIYEQNPGGTTKYYHLYRGYIPFSSVVESKIIYRDAPKNSGDHVLDIVQVGDPVLRIPARELSNDEILSEEIQQLILNMQATMRAAPGVGLAAPQIGRPIQLVVIEDVDHSHLTQEQLMERNRYKVPFHVVINPKIYIDDSNRADFFEACLSISDYMGIVSRATAVRVECLNEQAEPVEINATGWYARILQHEIDHLNATLYIDHAKLPTMMTQSNFVKFWKDKPIVEILRQLSGKGT
jgi:peptide deformylase